MTHSWHSCHHSPSKSHVGIAGWSLTLSHGTFNYRILPSSTDSPHQPGKSKPVSSLYQSGSLGPSPPFFYMCYENKNTDYRHTLMLPREQEAHVCFLKIPSVCLFVSFFILINKCISYSKDTHTHPFYNTYHIHKHVFKVYVCITTNLLHFKWVPLFCNWWLCLPCVSELVNFPYKLLQIWGRNKKGLSFFLSVKLFINKI